MIYAVIALSAEARPLIGHFQLEKAAEHAPLAVFRSDDLALIVGGVGQEETAQAVDQLARAVPADKPAAWLNIGVAGHRQLEIGTAVLARTVTDAASGEVYELVPPEDLHLEIGEVRTVSHVETKYETESLYDMEAAAFCRRALSHTTPELVQVLKIVSDNRRTGTLCVSARQVQGLIEESFPRIDRVVASLHRLARQLTS